MKNIQQKPKKAAVKTGFWQRPSGYFLSTVVFGLIGYFFVSLAIDTGSLLAWALGLIAVARGLMRLVQGIKRGYEQR